MSEVNASDWWAVLFQGEWFVGQRKESVTATDHRAQRYTLTHLQKLNMGLGVEVDRRGNSRPKIQMLTFPWFLEQLEVPEGALWISVASFPTHQGWTNMIASTEKLKLEQRAQRAGVHLV